MRDTRWMQMHSRFRDWTGGAIRETLALFAAQQKGLPVRKIIAEITAILHRDPTPLERLRIRSCVLSGMVNPFDIIATLNLS